VSSADRLAARSPSVHRERPWIEQAELVEDQHGSALMLGWRKGEGEVLRVSLTDDVGSAL
jgi:hypothetical protein